MILFSTLLQGWQVWLFCYLGFVSGIIFFVVLAIANYASKRAELAKIKIKQNMKQDKDNLQMQNLALRNGEIQVNHLEQSKHTKQSKKDKKHLKYNKSAKHNKHVEKTQKDGQRLAIRKERISTFFAKILLLVTKFGVEVACIVTFGGVVCGSLLTNLHFNYGLLPPVCVLIWIAFFMLSKFFLKSLAKIFLPIYNKYVANQENCENRQCP